MSRIKRIPFTLNLDDPVDAALWEALAPMLTRHRASAWLRSVAAQALGISGTIPILDNPDRSQPLALSAGESRSRLKSKSAVPQPPIEVEDDPDAVAEAASNFLSMFG